MRRRETLFLREGDLEMKRTLRIGVCPACGSDKIRRVRRDWRGEFQGRRYVVPSLSFYECPACGEKVYEPQAMQKIEAHSPAFSKNRARQTALQGKE